MTAIERNIIKAACEARLWSVIDDDAEERRLRSRQSIEYCQILTNSYKNRNFFFTMTARNLCELVFTTNGWFPHSVAIINFETEEITFTR